MVLGFVIYCLNKDRKRIKQAIKKLQFKDLTHTHKLVDVKEFKKELEL